MTTNELRTAMMTALSTYTENPTEENRKAFEEADKAYVGRRVDEILKGM